MRKHCGNCANHSDETNRFSEECGKCVVTVSKNRQKSDPSHWKAKPQTNADKIRAMSDEELAHELALVASWDRSEFAKAKKNGLETFMMNWLKQSAKEDE